jgi:hypothetical protein
MDAVVGGPVACFVSVFWKLLSTYILLRAGPLRRAPLWVVRRLRLFACVAKVFSHGVCEEKRCVGRKCGVTPLNFAVVWAGLNARSPRVP